MLPGKSRKLFINTDMMNIASRIVIAIASLSLIATYFVPFWFIHLIAPQYPEGLTMQIWLYKLTGQVEIINGLNHYIGMEKINEDMFPELDMLVYIVAGYIMFGLIVAFTGSRKLLFIFIIVLIIGAIVAMIDMYKWGYDYGHNLDESAPIQVPGLSYQPPLIGHKKLLNFDAYSYPDTGGWITAGAVVVFLVTWFIEKRRNRKNHVAKQGSIRSTALSLIVICLLSGCSVEPQKITYGKDQCDECKMTIMDPKFGAEVITKKGKVYKFDDAHCVVHFLRSAGMKEQEIAQTVFINFENKDEFLEAKTAHFVVSPQLKSPMNSNAAAFGTKTAAENKASEINGKLVDWRTLTKTL